MQPGNRCSMVGREWLARPGLSQPDAEFPQKAQSIGIRQGEAPERERSGSGRPPAQSFSTRRILIAFSTGKA